MEFNTREGQNVCPGVYGPPIGTGGPLYPAATSAETFCITPRGTEKRRFGGGDPWLRGLGGSNDFAPPPTGTDGALFSILAEGKIYAFSTGAAGQRVEGSNPWTKVRPRRTSPRRTSPRHPRPRPRGRALPFALGIGPYLRFARRQSPFPHLSTESRIGPFFVLERGRYGAAARGRDPIPRKVRPGLAGPRSCCI